MAHVEVIPVQSPAELRDFIDLPWKVYAGDPNWVPPLKREIQRLLDPEAHPFWQFSERTLFLARRGAVTVGRVAAIVDHNYNRFHDERMGSWGFFECLPDREAAGALLAAAADWTRQQGMAFLRGPLNPSTNYEVGLLIHGCDAPPVFMMTYNPAYYDELLTSLGLVKEKDLLSFRVDRSWQPPDWVGKVAQRIKEKNPIRIRTLRFKDLKNELPLVRDIYHEAWFDNWGFVPMTDAELHDMGKQLLRISDPDLAFLLYYEDEPAGVALIVPDVNPIIKVLNGKIGLLGWLKILLNRGKIKGMRGLIFGIRRKYQELGLPLVAFDYLYELLQQRKKYRNYQYIELGWNLEDNDLINQWFADGGAQVDKRYRIYRNPL